MRKTIKVETLVTELQAKAKELRETATYSYGEAAHNEGFNRRIFEERARAADAHARALQWLALGFKDTLDGGGNDEPLLDPYAYL